jgi:hypothetical protein
MFKINQITIIAFFISIFSSCNGQYNYNINNCNKDFEEARRLSYSNSTPKLDSALRLANACLKCDSIRKAVVDFKITLLVSLKKYSEGIKFIESLSENDFLFSYKMKLALNELQALVYKSKGDTVKEKATYVEISKYLEQYGKEQKNLSDKEFKEVYTDLFSVKEYYQNANQINENVRELITLYPERASFFNFFKK